MLVVIKTIFVLCYKCARKLLSPPTYALLYSLSNPSHSVAVIYLFSVKYYTCPDLPIRDIALQNSVTSHHVAPTPDKLDYIPGPEDIISRSRYSIISHTRTHTTHTLITFSPHHPNLSSRKEGGLGNKQFPTPSIRARCGSWVPDVLPLVDGGKMFYNAGQKNYI